MKRCADKDVNEETTAENGAIEHFRKIPRPASDAKNIQTSFGNSHSCEECYNNGIALRFKSPSNLIPDAPTVDPSLLFQSTSTAVHVESSLTGIDMPVVETKARGKDKNECSDEDQTVAIDLLSNKKSQVSRSPSTKEPSKRTSIMTQHIQSVLRYSTTDSWRSSCLSVTSTNTCEDGMLSPTVKSPSQSSSHWSSRFSKLSPFHRTKSKLSSGEQIIWDEMIDETLLQPKQNQEYYFEASAVRRKCCHLWKSLKLPLPCEVCGFSKIHQAAITSRIDCLDTSFILIFNVKDFFGSSSTSFIDAKDYFDNTALHFAAAATAQNSERIIRLIESGLKVDCRNTSGETFLHILFYNIGNGISRLDLDLLRALSKFSFPFLEPDYHGRTALHRLFEKCSKSEGRYLKKTKELLSILRPDINAVDNQGNSLGQQVAAALQHDYSPSQISELLSQYRTPDRLTINYHQEFSRMHSKWTVCVNWMVNLRLSTWFDVNGDTPLIAMLKAWNDADDELSLLGILNDFIEQGCNIHMRDRNGDTALAIATRRGLRPAVTALLGLGANAYARSYRGKGIIAQAKEQMRFAKKESNDSYYSKVLSCTTLITDSGAKLYPRSSEGWVSSESMPKFFHYSANKGKFMTEKKLAENGFL
jgi:ankyrin repeat protein